MYVSVIFFISLAVGCRSYSSVYCSSLINIIAKMVRGRFENALKFCLIFELHSPFCETFIMYCTNGSTVICRSSTRPNREFVVMERPVVRMNNIAKTKRIPLKFAGLHWEHLIYEVLKLDLSVHYHAFSLVLSDLALLCVLVPIVFTVLIGSGEIVYNIY